MFGPIEDLLHSKEVDDDGWVRIASLRWDARNLICDLCVDESYGGRTVVWWQVSCREVRDFLITDVNGGGLQIDGGDHPVVRQHSDPRVDLSFRGQAADPIRLIGSLWQVHREICDDWIPFDRYVNTALPLEELLASRSGKLAAGPRFLLEAYVRALHDHGVSSSLSGERPVARFVDGQWREQQKSLLVMHCGQSFVVAEQFGARRLEGEPGS